MSIWLSLRRIFGHVAPPAPPTEVIAARTDDRRAVEVYRPTPSEPIDGEHLLVQFRDQLTSQAQSQQQLTTLLASLNTTLHALPQLARQQGQVLETLVEGAVRARQRDQTIERSLTHLTEGADRQTQVLGLVQQQLDLNHEISLRVAESLRETAGALGTFAVTSYRHARALETLAQSTQRRVAQSDRLEKSLQWWIAVIAFICTLALVYSIWAATRGPVIIAMPVQASAQPAPTAVPSLAPTPSPSPSPSPQQPNP